MPDLHDALRAPRELAYLKMMREQGADAVIIVGGVIETPEYRKQLAHHAPGAEFGRLPSCPM